jgi:hypothetical protein
MRWAHQSYETGDPFADVTGSAMLATMLTGRPPIFADAA